MSNSKLRSLDLIQVDGGLSTKQGDTWSRIAYQLVDENEESIRVNDAENVTVYLKNENGLYQLNGILEGDEVGFYLTPQVTNGSYQVEIQIKHETGRISKFPSTNTVTLKVVKSLVNQESLKVSVMDLYGNNNLPEDPETGEKVLVTGDNSIGWYRMHSDACEIILTTNASDPLKLYSDFPEKRTYYPDNSRVYDHNKVSFVDISAGDDYSGHYIHERRNIDSHFIKISVSAFMVEEPRVLSIPITDMSTGSSTTFDIKVYPYNWYDPETKLIRNPSVNAEETEGNSGNQPVIDNSQPETTENHSESEGSTTSPQEGNTFTQPTIDKSELIRLEEEKLKAEGYKIVKNKFTGDKEYQSSDMMENFMLIYRNGVVTREDVVPSPNEDYEQIWPVVDDSNFVTGGSITSTSNTSNDQTENNERSSTEESTSSNQGGVTSTKPTVRDIVSLMTSVDINNPSFKEVKSLDTNNVIREHEYYLYIIRDEDISLLEGDQYSSMNPQPYTFKLCKEYIEKGIKADRNGEIYPLYYLVSEFNGDKYYVEATDRVWSFDELPFANDAESLATVVYAHESLFDEIKSLDTNDMIREDDHLLYHIRDEHISKLEEGEYSDREPKPYTFNLFKEYLLQGLREDTNGESYPMFFFVAEYDGNKYYVKGE